MRKKLLTLVMAVLATTACHDFVDENGETSFRQVAEGLQSLGDRLEEMGEALERDANIEPVPWDELSETIPNRVRGADRIDTEGDRKADRNGAGMSVAHTHFEIEGDSAFVGVADLGALQSGAQLALRWAAELFARGEIDGDIEEVDVEGFPGIQIRDDDDDAFFVATLVEGRFVVAAAAHGYGHEDFVWRALDDIDYRQLERWADYGR